MKESSIKYGISIGDALAVAISWSNCPYTREDAINAVDYLINDKYSSIDKQASTDWLNKYK